MDLLESSLQLPHQGTDRHTIPQESLSNCNDDYKWLFANSLDGIFRSTIAGRFIDANPALVHMLGYNDKNEFYVLNIPDDVYYVRSDRCITPERITPFTTRFKKKDGSVIWVEVTSWVARDEAGNAIYYEGIVRNITERKRTEEALLQSLAKLRQVTGSVIHAVVKAVEVRDPYTAGHQKRVADVARAIATEMKLSADQIEGIYVAGSIHDLGKIAIPAEILSMPRRLTEIEFGLIKTHSQHGYDILKDIESEWPIAETVLQHHERLNGSGYPNELKGGEIRLEALIIAAADVVEAIASHRPYRPAYSICVALEELSRHKGILYDPDVVDACIRVFKNNKSELLGLDYTLGHSQMYAGHSYR